MSKLGIFKANRAHDIKCWPSYFEALLQNVKHFELRNNDRNYQVDDVLFIHEYDPDTELYTGRSLVRRVSFVVTEGPWLTPGYAALSLQEVL